MLGFSKHFKCQQSLGNYIFCNPPPVGAARACGHSAALTGNGQSLHMGCGAGWGGKRQEGKDITYQTCSRSRAFLDVCQDWFVDQNTCHTSDT